MTANTTYFGSFTDEELSVMEAAYEPLHAMYDAEATRLVSGR